MTIDDVFKRLASEFLNDEPMFPVRIMRDENFLFTDRTTIDLGKRVDGAAGGSCPLMVRRYLRAVPRRHKKISRWEYYFYDEKDVPHTGWGISVIASFAAERLFRFLEARNFEGDAETLIGLYLAESIGA